MKWSWRIGRLAGIELRVHATFLILLGWLALLFYREAGPAGAARGVVFTLALFASVVLHELGHALTARRFGVGTRDITLLPIGGVARLESIPEQPWRELWVALAGPAVTLAIIVVLWAVLRLLQLPTGRPEELLTQGGGMPAELMWANVSLLVFNLLPAFPMDGGRVLRALLAMRMGHARATEHAARVGRAFALLFGLVGLIYNPLLVVIALFVWLGAAGEAAVVHMRDLLGGVPVERLMIRDVRTLAPTDTLETALGHVLAGFQQDFPVVDGGRVVGVLTRAGMLAALAREGPAAAVRGAMATEFRTASPREAAEGAVARLRECECHTMPVLEGGALRGVLTLDNVGEYVMIESALRTRPTGDQTADRPLPLRGVA